MLAGTLAQLSEPTDNALESHFGQAGGFPALDVEKTQGSFDDRPIQSGTAAGHVRTVEKDISAGVNADGEYIAIDIDQVERSTTVATEWVADPTESGLIAAESVHDGDLYPFPFDLFYAICGTDVKRLAVDLAAMHDAWTADDVLGDVWFVGSADADTEATRMAYHDAADADETPNIGLGFTRPWQNTVMRGVAYGSGYVAVYNTGHISRFMRFLADEVLPFAEQFEGPAQTTL